MTAVPIQYAARRRMRAALMALILATGFAPAAFAGAFDIRPDTRHQGPYDNTGNGPQQTGLEGGGG